ncbi:MAG: HEAT repeat domain-containing protein [Gemmataceae bacterium]
MLIRFSFALVSLIALAPTVCRSQPAADFAEDEKLLATAGLATDGPGLLEFFRKRTLGEAEVKRLGLLIPQLGDNDFVKRQKASDALAVAGPPALPYLRQALDDLDQEVQRRARECIDTIEKGPNSARAAAAARLLRAKRPKEPCGVLLSFLPFADDDNVKEAVVGTLMVLAVHDGKVEDSLLSALRDKTPVKRAAGALAVGRSGTAQQRKVVQSLLTDFSFEVRLAAAQGLAAARDKTVAPALTVLLTEASPSVAQQAEDLLQRMAGERAPTVAWEETKRQSCRDAWEAWWKSEGERLDLAKADVDPLKRNPTHEARQVASLFLDALVKGKTVDFKKITAVPFHVHTHQTFTTHEELIKNFTEEAKQAQNQKITFEMKKAMPIAEFEKNPNANKEVLTKVDKRQLYASLVTLNLPGNQTMEFAILVRVSGGKALVVGITNCDGQALR